MQHIHILGICGTFMGGIAAIAKQLGYKVSGCDANVYPPMSTQLEALGIELTEGYDISQLKQAPDLVIIGNAMSRGNPLVEYVLERKIPYTSGPEWLLVNVLKERWVLAVSGTHGKTTTSSMLAWILEYAGLKPGFLIGGIPQNFGFSARAGDAPFFVIEADEYDTAFFDKRSKFVHYRPNTLVINNLEFDHADIFDSLADIQRQFHHLIRMVPGNGLILAPHGESAIEDTLSKGCWTPVEYTGVASGWQSEKLQANGSEFNLYFNQVFQGRVNWSLIGDFNIENAMMAVAAARHAGVPVAVATEALGHFVNTKRRLEKRGEANGITVYDDFAHHPTAIEKTLSALRSHVGNERIIAVLEPRSNTMKRGVHKDQLPQALKKADQVFIHQGEAVQWSVAELVSQCAQPVATTTTIEDLVNKIADVCQRGDHVLIMSNGGFGGIHQKLLECLQKND